MRIIARKTLLDYANGLTGKDGPAVWSSLQAWVAETVRAQWKSSAEVKASFATASVVSADRVVFNIKGNDHRLVVSIKYSKAIVWVIWIGTHKAYDSIDVRTIRHGK
jgi:mRNA interferase HigB